MMSCIRKGSLRISLSKDELDCMRDSYQHQRLQPTIVSSGTTYSNGDRNHRDVPQKHDHNEDNGEEEEMEQETSPAVPDSYMNGQATRLNVMRNGHSYPSSIPVSNQRSHQSSSLLKKALANRIKPVSLDKCEAQSTPSSDSHGFQEKSSNAKEPSGAKPFSTQTVANENPEKCLATVAPREMSTSILVNAAWYRDNEGRTGFRTNEWVEMPNVQTSAIKKVNATINLSPSAGFKVGETAVISSPPSTSSAPMNGIGRSAVTCIPSYYLTSILPSTSNATIPAVKARPRSLSSIKSVSFTTNPVAELPPNGKSRLKTLNNYGKSNGYPSKNHCHSPNSGDSTGQESTGDESTSSNSPTHTKEGSNSSMSQNSRASHKSVTFAEPVEVEGNDLHPRFIRHLQNNGSDQLEMDLTNEKEAETSDEYKPLAVEGVGTVGRARNLDLDMDILKLLNGFSASNSPKQEHNSPDGNNSSTPRPTMNDLEWRMIQTIYSNLIQEDRHKEQSTQHAALLQAMANDLSPSKQMTIPQPKAAMVRSASGYMEKSRLVSPDHLPDGLQGVQQQEISFYDNVPSEQQPSGLSIPSADTCKMVEKEPGESWLRAKFLYKYGAKKDLGNGSNSNGGGKYGTREDGLGSAVSNPSSVLWETPPKDPKPREHQHNHYLVRSEAKVLKQTIRAGDAEASRDMSSESIGSSGSRESVVSAASIAAEHKGRRYFNY